MNKTIIMFDMDGTLTKPRQLFDGDGLEYTLYKLTNMGIHIGIITGSDEDYLREQMGNFLTKSSCRYKTHLLPCNGTKYFVPPKFANHGFELHSQISMEEEIGTENYQKLIQELLVAQVAITQEQVPLTGHFINCRGSMINWSPIGRNANTNQRERFVTLDKKSNLRAGILGNLKRSLEQNGTLQDLTIKFGGDTSFDIYPNGWDKTYGLKHFEGWDVWFVGDRCTEIGNDYEIYRACSGQSYITTGPKKTEEIIKTIIDRIKEKE